MILREEKTQQILHIRALHVFGRNVDKADTVLTSVDASQIHAVIRWIGQHWEILDHSRNGTFINDKRIVTNTITELFTGQRIRFSPSSSHCWIVENVATPVPLLLRIDQDCEAITLNKVQFLPNETDPLTSIHLSSQGLWIWQNDVDSRVLIDGDVISIASQRWQFFNPKKEDDTIDISAYIYPLASNATFHFQVSLNEEHVALAVTAAGKAIDLGERTHHYSLLTLARRRIEDIQRGIEESAQGWVSVEELSKMLGVEPPHLNMQLFRARGQLARQIPEQSDLLDVIERRRGEVRFASIAVEINRGKQLEARLTPAITTFRTTGKGEYKSEYPNSS